MLRRSFLRLKGVNLLTFFIASIILTASCDRFLSIQSFALSDGGNNATSGATSETALYQWNFDSEKELEGWYVSHLSPLEIKENHLFAKYQGGDPFFVITGIDFVPKAGQLLELRIRSNGSGEGELFYASSHEGPYGGFSQNKTTRWQMVHDGKWRTYRIDPGWLGEPKIIKLRIDLGAPDSTFIGKTVEVESIRIVDQHFDNAPAITPKWDAAAIKSQWTTSRDNDRYSFLSPVGKFEAENGGWLTIELDNKSGDFSANKPVIIEDFESPRGTIRFWGGKFPGIREVTFPITNRYCHIDLAKNRAWNGPIYRIDVQLPDDSWSLKAAQVGNAPTGPAQCEALYSGMQNAVNRTDVPVNYTIRLKNTGGLPLENLSYELLRDGNWEGIKALPAQLCLMNDKEPGTKPVNVTITADKFCAGKIATLAPMETVDLIVPFESSRAGQFSGTVRLTGEDVNLTVPLELQVTESLHLPKADYVPKPIPATPNYELGAYYFPGWPKRPAWDKINRSQPVRKPVLGWYDEANVEVVDWQVKWAVESGIQFFFVDWYWTSGSQQLDHWIKAFQQSRYRSHLHWAVMWANHNPPRTHSPEDTKAVTEFWIENYFNTPEYYYYEGKPVVIIWAPSQIDEDYIAIESANGRSSLQKGDGVKMFIAESNQAAIEAGYKGIYFIAMKFPEASTDVDTVLWLKNAGFDATSIYHFMHHGNKTTNTLCFPFDFVVDANLPYLEARAETGLLPFFPNISTGWDSRPWHGQEQTIIHSRTVAKFRQICEEVRDFVDKNETGPIVLSPLNEWGEGSYIEPNLEFGFEMYETLRDIFCEKPAEGFPPFVAPADVGLGPYDLPE